jgi:enterochelin esterase-like enzyme
MIMNFWQKPIETLQELLNRKAPHIRQVRHRFSQNLQRDIDFDIFLPPDYHLSTGRRYPLVLFNDGQDLPVMGFSKILENLYFNRQIPYIIAVGVYAGYDRHREYGTARQADYKGRGDKAPQYRDFIVTELLPFLKGRFRLNGDRNQTVYAGFSLGGLSAMDIAWAYPQMFGAVGVFSGAFWWRWSPVSDDDPDADRILHDVIEKTPEAPENQRYWFQCGTLDEEEDRNRNGVIDAIDDTLDLISALKRKGVPEEAIRYLEIENGHHDPKTWGVAMPDFLRWVLADKGALM